MAYDGSGALQSDAACSDNLACSLVVLLKEKVALGPG